VSSNCSVGFVKPDAKWHSDFNGPDTSKPPRCTRRSGRMEKPLESSSAYAAATQANEQPPVSNRPGTNDQPTHRIGDRNSGPDRLGFTLRMRAFPKGHVSQSTSASCSVHGHPEDPPGLEIARGGSPLITWFQILLIAKGRLLRNVLSGQNYIGAPNPECMDIDGPSSESHLGR
jgi:hypothetical protein